MKPTIWHIQGIELANEIDSTVVPNGKLSIWYLGQCGFIIKSNTCAIGIDLVLSELYNAQGNPRRLYPPPFSGGSAPKFTHLFCSHSHADHFDLPTVERILKSQSKVQCIIPAGIQEKGVSLPQNQMLYAVQNEAIKLNNECCVLPIMVAHEDYETDVRGFSKFLGYLFSFTGISLFHSGDAVFKQNLVDTLSRCLPINIMMLPINGTDSIRKGQGIIGICNLSKPFNLLPSHKLS
jgi:L-ascorbate metabolism protein UlaG (beta-lactamase superfamily)